MTQILKPNSDPHDYEPRPGDVRDSADAEIVFESGRRPRSLDAARRRRGRRLAADRRTRARRILHTGSPASRTVRAASRFDPHWWHDPRNVEAVVPVIRDALGGQPERARDLRAQRGRLPAQAAPARSRHRRLLRRDSGRAKRKLVTDHDAFGYFATRYGIERRRRRDPVADDAGAAFGEGRRASLRALVAAERVKAVFPESSVNAKLAEGDRARDRARRRATRSTATRSAAADSDGATYVAMELHNAASMVRGFTDGARGVRCRAVSMAGALLEAVAYTPATAPRPCCASCLSRRARRADRRVGTKRRRQDDAVPRPARRARAERRDDRGVPRVAGSSRRPSARGSTSPSARSTSR